MSAVRGRGGKFARKPVVPRCTDDQPPSVEYGGIQWGPADVGGGLGVGYALAVELAATREPEPDTEVPE